MEMTEKLILVLEKIADGQQKIVAALESLAETQAAMFECQSATSRDSRDAMRKAGVLSGVDDAGGA